MYWVEIWTDKVAEAGNSETVKRKKRRRRRRRFVVPRSTLIACLLVFVRQKCCVFVSFLYFVLFEIAVCSHIFLSRTIFWLTSWHLTFRKTNRKREREREREWSEVKIKR
jgi:hypothetical protein